MTPHHEEARFVGGIEPVSQQDSGDQGCGYVLGLCQSGMASATIARVIGNWIFDRPALRAMLVRTGRARLYSAVIEFCLTNGPGVGPVATADLAAIATDLIDFGRPDLTIALCRAVAQPGGTASLLPLARAYALTGAVEAALALCRDVSRQDSKPAGWLEWRYLEGWVDYHLRDDAVAATVIRDAIAADVLQAAWPDAAAAESVMDAVQSDRGSALVAAAIRVLAAASPIAPGQAAHIQYERFASTLPHLAKTIATMHFAEALHRPEPVEALGDFYQSHGGELIAHKLRARWQRNRLVSAHLAGAVSCVSPFDGRLLTTEHAIAVTANVTIYPFIGAAADQAFFLLSTAWNVSRKDLLIVPQCDLLVQLGADNDTPPAVHVLQQCLAFFRANSARIQFYLQRPSSPALVFGTMWNIGHHYHNEVAGLFRLLETDTLPPTTPILCVGRDYYHVLQGLDAEHRQMVRPLQAAEAVGGYCLERRLSPCRALDVAAPRALARHVLEAFGVAPVRPEARDAVLFMLRSNRRVWRSQTASTLALIKLLAHEFGVRSILLDGMTLTDPDDAGERSWIQAEQAIAARIIADAAADAAVAGVTITSLVGLRMEDKVATHQSVRLAIAPKGNGLVPNLSWIRNCPTVVHGNAQDLMFAAYEAKYREDATLPLTPDRDAIIDSVGRVLDSGSMLTADEQLTLDYDVELGAMMALVRDAMTLAADPPPNGPRA